MVAEDGLAEIEREDAPSDGGAETGARFARLEIQPTYQLVYESLEREIVSGRLVPGEPLPTETALALQLGVNRSTVREGIRLLEQSGFVKRASGRRLHVTLPHYADLAPRQARALVMQRVSFRELWEVSVELEPLAARLAAGRISAAQLEALEANLAATAAAVLAGRSVVELDIAFHQLIAEAAGNRVLLLAREPISSLFYPAITAMFERPPIREVGPRRLIAAHRAILDALATGDGATAARWMAKHIVDFKRGYDVCGLDLDATVERMPARRGVAAT